MTFNEMILAAPHAPGIYKMWDSGDNLLYVGKAKDLIKRLRQYADIGKLEYHKIIMRRQVARVSWQTTATEQDALVLEQRLIKTERPKYNIVFTDDKMYPYLMLSKDKFPRLIRCRGKNLKNAFGPFPFIADLDQTIKLVQKVCRIRTCKDMERRKRPCILYQTGRCGAPCCMPDPDYKNRVALARRLLRGHVRLVVSELSKKMRAAAKAEDYESAARFRSQIESLQTTTETASMLGKVRGTK